MDRSILICKNEFCGKEAMTLNAWDVYDSLARFQRMSYPRFTSPNPLAEKYYGVSPYAYAGNDFVNIVDPTGRDLILTGDDAQKAYALLQEKFKNQLSITIEEAERIGYKLLPNTTLSKEAKKLIEIINNHLVKVYVKGIREGVINEHAYFIGGAFMGNKVYKDSEGEIEEVVAIQYIDPEFIYNLDMAINKPGKNLMHEITEAYEGAMIAIKKGEDIAPAILKEEQKANDDYNQAHRKATKQTVISWALYDDYIDYFIVSNNRSFLKRPIKR